VLGAALCIPLLVEVLHLLVEHLVGRGTGELQITLGKRRARLPVRDLPKAIPAGFSLVFATLGVDLSIALTPEVFGEHQNAVGPIPKTVALAVSGLLMLCIATWLASKLAAVQWPDGTGALQRRSAVTSATPQRLELTALSPEHRRAIIAWLIPGYLCSTIAVALPVWVILL
jgi:hypothetical protein